MTVNYSLTRIAYEVNKAIRLPFLQGQHILTNDHPFLQNENHVFAGYNTMLDQSRLQASWSAGGHQGRLWGTGIFTAEILRLTVLSFVTANSQSKN